MQTKREIGSVNNVFPQTIAVALLINLKLINYSLTKITGNQTDGYFPILFALIYGLFFGSVTIQKYREKSLSKIRIKSRMFLFVMLLIAWYLISYQHTETSVFQYACYAVLPVIVCYSGNININVLLKTSLLLGIAALPVSSELLALSYYNTINMDICYAFLPCIVAAIIDFFSRTRNSSKFTILLYIVPLYYLGLLLASGMRGTIMCVFIATVAIIFFGPNRRRFTWLSACIILALFVGIVFSDDIFISANDFFQARGINFYFLTKTISHSNDITNGRTLFWAKAIDGFIDSPIIGKGVNTYNYWTGLLYPHNFILQFMFEGGAITLIWFFYIYIKGTYKLFINNISEDIELYWYTFCISVPYLFVSANVWSTPLLWIFIGILLRNCSNGYVKPNMTI